MPITAKEFKQRRQRFFRCMDKEDVAIVFAASEKQRNQDVHYPFRQNSDFYYLTGFDEPCAVAVFIARHRQFVLFCEEDDPHTAQWIGARAGTAGAMQQYGATHAWSIEELDEVIPELLADKHTLYYPTGVSCHWDRRISGWIKQVHTQARSGIKPPAILRNVQDIVHGMRLKKSPAEIRIMRRAARLSAQAHKQAMQVCSPGKYEHQLEAEINYICAQAGCRQQAYPAIVGGGANACILHYTDNNQALQDGALVLIDAGAELHNYASDITRTFPVNGVFSTAQKAVYEWVLKAQLAAIRQVKPGKSFYAPHQTAVRVLTRGLVEMGLLKGDVAQLVRKGAYRKFYMHRTGHWLGMDVHDVGAYKVKGKWRKLEPGMVLTVEPGLYIAEGMKGVAKKWQGIGIRIEDDVLVTQDGCEVLSRDVPKTVQDIEALMRS